MRLRLVRVVAIISLLSMMAAPVTAQPLAGVTVSGGAAVAPQAAATAFNPGLEKLHPDLRDLARTATPPGAGAQYASAGASNPVYVEVITAYARDGSDKPNLSAFFIDGKFFSRPAFGKGDTVSQVTFGEVYPYSLRKLAAMATVQFVLPVVFEQNGQPDPYPADDVDTPPLSAEELALRQAAARTLADNAPAWDQARAIGDGGGTNTPADWFEVTAEGPHKAEVAWERGFTGAGVTVAVNDDGIDTAHPDLMGTQRIYSSTLRTVYNGWPMVFSPFSAFLYLNDEAFGTSYISNGFPGAHYVDTRATPALTTCSPGVACFDFQPLLDYGVKGITHTYTLSSSMSASGEVHAGTHPDFDLIYVWGERPAIIVTDPITPGVYSTVYVDLDNDYDFRDEKPLTKADVTDLGATYNNMVSYRDLDADGLADISGGMLYFIGNGATCIPAMDWIYGCGAFGALLVPGNGDLVAFSGGSFDREYSHGTQIASNIAGQGVVSGLLPQFNDLPGDGVPDYAIQGMAPDAKLVNVSDIYYNFESSLIDAYFFAAVGYDRCDQTGYNWYTGGGCGDTDPIQVTNNSYGNSDQDNDGWDFLGQLVTQIQYFDAPYLQFMFSTGNGAPGYGTAAPPSPATGIAVGASTEFGSTGWDSITSTTQIMNNDVIPFSNRGPSARGTTGVDVVAGGAYAAGAEELNYYAITTWGTPDGNRSWNSWGGTSRSAPVAAGVLALIYGAYKDANGDWPDAATAQSLLMSTATDLNYDTFTQGSGSVNADRGTAVAAGLYGLYMKEVPAWQPGDYRGDDFPAFAHVVYAGESYTRAFTIVNSGVQTITAGLDDTELLLINSQTQTMTITPEMVAAESVFGPEDSDNFYKAFNFFLPITATDSVILANPDWANIVVPADADLMIVRLMYPYDEFDVDGDYTADNRFYLNVYNWDDVNGDNDVWEDKNSNGVVNFINSHDITLIDGGDELVWDDPATELDQWEFGRFGYHRPTGNTLEMWVQDPAERMLDGLFIGLRHHPAARADITTVLNFRIEFYREEDVTWLSTSTSSVQVPPGDEASFVATVDVPADMPTGMYQAAIEVSDPGWMTYTEATTVIPVALAVVEAFSDGLTLGGYTSYNYDLDRPYNNGAVRGLHDWSWRPESGDWRFFMTDVINQAAVADVFPAGTQFIVRDDWEAPAPWTDIDSIVLGPTPSSLGNTFFGDFEDPAVFGPYVLDTVGKSVNTNVAAGIWLFDTATGGPTEFVAAPLQDGLHAFLAHNVLFDGTQHDVVFTKTIGTAAVAPTSLITTTGFNSGTIGTLAFESSLSLTGLEAEGFGLSQPNVFTDEPLPDGGGYDFEFEFTVEHGASIQVETDSADVSDLDLDLDLYYCGPATGQAIGAGGCTLIGSSAGGTAVEFVEVIGPDDGVYLVAIENFSGPAGTFEMTVTAIQGNGMTVTGLPGGAVPADTPVLLTVNFNQELEIGQTYRGLILLGPTEAPTVMQVEVEVTRAGARIYLPILGN